MKRKGFLMVLSGAMLFPAVGLLGCGEETKKEKTETISTPGGTTTTSSQTQVKSTGEIPPPNSAGVTAETAK